MGGGASSPHFVGKKIYPECGIFFWSDSVFVLIERGGAIPLLSGCRRFFLERSIPSVENNSFGK